MTEATETTSNQTETAATYFRLMQEMQKSNQLLQARLLEESVAKSRAEADAAVAAAARLAAEASAKLHESKATDAEKKVTETEAKVKEAEAKLEDLKKNGAVDAKSPGRRIVDRVGESAATRLADALEKNKASELQKELNEINEGMARALAESKKIEGNPVQFYHLDKSLVHWGGAAAAVIGIGVVTGVGYYCYNKGREAGQLDMVDARVTYESHGKR